MTSKEISQEREADPFPSEQETNLWVMLSLAYRKIYRRMDLELKAAGLPTLRWYDILWSLERNQGSGLRAIELKSMLIFEQSNLSRLLSRLIAEGLVEETVFAQDRRGKVLRITARGRVVRQKMWAIYGPLIHRHMRVISEPGDQLSVQAALNALFDYDDDVASSERNPLRH